MKELRCSKCNKLLAKYSENAEVAQGEYVIEILCTRCKEKNTLKFELDY